MTIFNCKACGAEVDGLKGDWRENATGTGQYLWCPNGHAIGFAAYPMEEE